MERIISFVVDHFFVVIIVLGLVYSMFFRKSPLEKRPPNRMPDFGSGPLFPQRPARPAVPAAAPPVEHKPHPVEHRAPQPEYRLPPAEPASVPRTAPVPDYGLPQAQPASRPVVRTEPMTAAAGSAAEPRLARAKAAPAAAVLEPADSPLTANDLTRAVVWAEILGPPRSRRPFRR